MEIPKNARTTVLGLGMIIGAIGKALVAILDDDPSTFVEWEVTVAAIVAGWGFVWTREQKQHDKDRDKGES